MHGFDLYHLMRSIKHMWKLSNADLQAFTKVKAENQVFKEGVQMYV